MFFHQMYWRLLNLELKLKCYRIHLLLVRIRKIIFVPHLSAFFDTLRVLLVKLKAFLWAPKKDFTPLCSKGVKFFFATATFFFATANFFLPTVVSTSSKKKVAVPQAVLIVPTLQWSRCFASKKYVVSSYMKLTLIHGIWNRNEDFIIFC